MGEWEWGPSAPAPPVESRPASPVPAAARETDLPASPYWAVSFGGFASLRIFFSMAAIVCPGQ